MKTLFANIFWIVVWIFVGYLGATTLQGAMFVSHYSERSTVEVMRVCQNFNDSYARPLLYGQLIGCEMLLRSSGETLFEAPAEEPTLRL